MNPKLGVGVVILVAVIGGIGFAGWKIFQNYKTMGKLKRQISSLKNQIRQLDNQIRQMNEPLLNKRLQEVSQMMGKLRKILPDLKPAEEDNLVAYLTTQRRNSGLVLVGKFGSVGNKATPISRNIPDVVRLQYKMTLEGHFINFLFFLHRLESPQKIAKFIKVEKFKIREGKGNLKRFEVLLSSYYYKKQ